MWKQALGFALFGATVAIVTAALTQGSAQASATITLFSGGTTISGFAGESQWTWPIEAAVIGALLGALTGFVLRLAGVRISGGQDNRMVPTVVAGLAGVTLGLTPLLVLMNTASYGCRSRPQHTLPGNTTSPRYPSSSRGCSRGTSA